MTIFARLSRNKRTNHYLCSFSLSRQQKPRQAGVWSDRIIRQKKAEELLQIEHILHVIKTGALLAQPLAGAHCTIGKGQTA